MSQAPKLLPPQILVPESIPAPISLTLPSVVPSERELSITRITHSCVLIQYGSSAILTDPWFSQKGGFPGYYSGESVAMGISDLPVLSGVLNSMDHYDHFDIETFASYRDRSVPIVVPAGTPQYDAARKAGFSEVRSLAPWGETQLGEFRVTAVCTKLEPATDSFEYEHAYIIEAGGRCVLFCSHLMEPKVQTEVARRFSRFDVAIVAVNGLHRKMNGRKLSMTPSDAAELCRTLNVEVAIPIHYAFHGGWVSSAFVIAHKGKPEALIDECMEVSPKTMVMVLSPGQRLGMSWGYDVPGTGSASQRKLSLLSFFAKLSVGDLSAFDLFAPNFVHRRPLPGAVDASREGAREAMRKLREAIPDMRTEVQLMVVEGDAIGVRILAKGRAQRPIPGSDAPLGPVSRQVTMLYRFEGAQIAEEWIDDDTSTAWAAMGGTR